MQEIERIVTLLQANVADGELADFWRSAMNEERRLFMSHDGLVAQAVANMDRYVNETVAEATSDILGSGGDLTTVGHVIGVAYSAGLLTGLASCSLAHR